jgi:hypothetical protein
MLTIAIAEASQIFLRDTFYQNDLAMRNTADRKVVSPSPLVRSISGVSANPLVDLYDIYGRRRKVQFFYVVPDTTRKLNNG